jgi:sulfur-carrier protein
MNALDTAPGTVRLLYFSWLRTRIGCAEEAVALPPGVGDVGALVAWLRTRGPGYAEALADDRVVKVAVNQEFARPDHRLREGDEIALFPPVTGG